jgi:hypothetical protein
VPLASVSFSWQHPSVRSGRRPQFGRWEGLNLYLPISLSDSSLRNLAMSLAHCAFRRCHWLIAHSGGVTMSRHSSLRILAIPRYSVRCAGNMLLCGAGNHRFGRTWNWPTSPDLDRSGYTSEVDIFYVQVSACPSACREMALLLPRCLPPSDTSPQLRLCYQIARSPFVYYSRFYR